MYIRYRHGLLWRCLHVDTRLGSKSAAIARALMAKVQYAVKSNDSVIGKRTLGHVVYDAFQYTKSSGSIS
jgi:hypothetical protein